MGRLGSDDAIDEALRESFPASDAPAWTGSHAGTPRASLEAPPLLRDVVQTLRDDVTFLRERPGYLEERFASLGWPVKQRPEGSGNVEAVVLGRVAPSRVVVIGAGREDAVEIAVLFALARSLTTSSHDKTVRLVVFQDAQRYADDLRRSGPTVDLMLGLERLGGGGRLRLVQPGWPRNLVRRGSRACHHLPFVAQRARALMVTNVGCPGELDFDRLALVAQALGRVVPDLARVTPPSANAERRRASIAASRARVDRSRAR